MANASKRCGSLGGAPAYTRAISFVLFVLGGGAGGGAGKKKCVDHWNSQEVGLDSGIFDLSIMMATARAYFSTIFWPSAVETSCRVRSAPPAGAGACA